MGTGTLMAPSLPPSPCLPTGPAARGSDQEAMGKSPGAGAGAGGPRLFSPPPLRCSPLHCSLPREGVGATCTWPGQERKVTHTKFNNQQRHILAGPCSHQAIPSTACSLLGLHRTRFSGQKRGEQARAASVCRGSLRGTSWTAGGGKGGGAWASRPRAGAPRAEVCPAPPQSSLLGQVNSGCCFGTRRSR